MTAAASGQPSARFMHVLIPYLSLSLQQSALCQAQGMMDMVAGLQTGHRLDPKPLNPKS